MNKIYEKSTFYIHTDKLCHVCAVLALLPFPENLEHPVQLCGCLLRLLEGFPGLSLADLFIFCKFSCKRYKTLHCGYDGQIDLIPASLQGIHAHVDQKQDNKGRKHPCIHKEKTACNAPQKTGKK